MNIEFKRTDGSPLEPDYRTRTDTAQCPCGMSLLLQEEYYNGRSHVRLVGVFAVAEDAVLYAGLFAVAVKGKGLLLFRNKKQQQARYAKSDITCPACGGEH